MNKLTKIGLTALAGSLVATSAFAGAMSVAGSASMNMEHSNGGAENTGKTFSMGNQLTFSGSGELDNGLNVSLSFVLDQADNETNTEAGGKEAPFDSHSVTVSSDSLGTLTLAGEGGSSAQTALDTSAAGDIWDNFDGHATGANAEILRGTSATSGNMLMYTLPSLMDDLTVKVSYVPTGSTSLSSTAWSVAYAGVDGLSVSYGVGEGSTNGTDEDVYSLTATYAYGPVTVGYSVTDYETSAANSTTVGDSEMTSYAITYTVSDELSVKYGTETISSTQTDAAQDGEYSSISASYVSGGMTITAAMQDAENIDGSTTATKDQERWALGASFAF